MICSISFVKRVQGPAMNVARKSTTKLPHNWSHIQAKEDETDSGIASTDSTDYHDSTSDNFQEVLFNLKALNGGPDVLETDRLELKESNTVSITSAKKENGNISVGVPAIREKGKDKDEDQDLLDQINDIVNEGKSCTSQSGRVAGSGHGAGQNNNVTVGSTSSPNTDEDEDMVMIIGEDNKEKSKELTPKDRNGTGTPRKHPLRIGDKVRSTVHSIMSKLVQSGNPEVSSLLNKVKSDECVETSSSADVPSIALARHDKGNLFDNLDFDICNKESKLSKADSSSGHQKPVLGGKECKQLPASPKAQEKARNSAGKRKNDIAEPFDNSLPKSKAADVLDSNGPLAHPEVDSHSLDNCDDQDRLTELKSGVTETNQTHSVTDEKNDVTKISRSDDVDRPEPDQSKPSDSPQEKKNACDATGLASLCADGDKENLMLPKNECKSSVCEKDDVSEKDKEVEPSMDTSLKSHDDGEKDSERKRQNESQESESGGSQPAKRSRLDWMIGKLGERISIPPESVETESLDCDDSNMEDSESAEKHSEGVSVSASEDEDERTSVSSPKTLRLTSKELDSVICSKVKAYLARQQATELKLLNARVQELLKSEEEWRNKAKDLERKLTELSLKQHKLEKRKAHTAALRSITTRNIGVQVNEEKLKSSTPQKVPRLGHSGTPLASPSSPTSSAPSLVISSLAGQTRMLTPVSSSPPTKVTAITVGQTLGSRNTSVAQLLSQTAHMPTAATSVSSSSKPSSVPSSNGPVPSSAVVPVSNASVRSLLDQASSLSKATTSNSIPPTNLVFVNAPPGMPLVSKGMTPGTVAGSAILTAATGVTTAPSSIKVIDLTVEDDGSAAKQAAKQVQVVSSPGQVHNLVPQQVVRQITPISQGIQGSTSAILLSSSAGTQIVTTPNMPRPPGMYQVVTIANAPPLRPGSLLTVVSGQPALVRQPGPAGTNISRAQTPQILAPPPPTMTIMRPAQVLGLSTTVRPSLATSTTSTTARMPVVATSVLPSSSAPLALPDSNPSNKTKIRIGHPAPLPAAVYRNVLNETKPPPPQPGLKISRVKQGIVLSWNMVIPKDCVEIAAYQLFAYQETSSPPSTSLWKKVGDVKALPLPMACTLTQFQDGNKYHFAVRAVDIHGRTSNFSEPAFIFLSKTS